MNIKEKYQKLSEEIKKHNYHYYVENAPIISDPMYDHIYNQVLEMEKEYPELITSDSPSQNVGHIVMSKLPKTKHEIPLLSLDKKHSIEELQSFMGNQECLVSLKIDGLTTETDYNKGKLYEASTRGDKYTGEVITHNAKTIKNLPQKVEYQNVLKVAGESFIYINDFEAINEPLSEEEKFSNCRSLAAGSVQQLDNKICKERKIKYFAFNLLKAERLNFTKKSEQLKWLKEQGFQVVPYIITNKNKIEMDIDNLKNYALENYIPIDGMVITYNDITYSKSLGQTAKHPRDSVSYKFEDERNQTKYIETEWNTSRTGKINPTAIFEPVEIDGTKVERATLFNLDIFKNLQLGKGDLISVYKANMIIPQIDGNFTCSNTEKIPVECPTCKAPTEIRKIKEARQLYCTNENCSAKKIDKIVHFCSKKGMNIEGISEATIEKFVNKGFIKDITDIYNLSQYKNQIINMSGFGKKSYENLINAIEESKKRPLNHLIFALGILGIGEVTAKDLANEFKSLDKLEKTTFNDLIFIDGIGDTTTKNIIDHFKNEQNKNIIKKLKEYGVNTKAEEKKNIEGKLSNLIFVITGELSKPRNEFIRIIEENGSKVTGSVSGKTNYVIVGRDPGKNKLIGAEKNKKKGVKIITEEEFWNLLK